jgi:hypothetical protein
LSQHLVPADGQVVVLRSRRPVHRHNDGIRPKRRANRRVQDRSVRPPADQDDLLNALGAQHLVERRVEEAILAQAGHAGVALDRSNVEQNGWDRGRGAVHHVHPGAARPGQQRGDARQHLQAACLRAAGLGGEIKNDQRGGAGIEGDRHRGGRRRQLLRENWRAAQRERKTRYECQAESFHCSDDRVRYHRRNLPRVVRMVKQIARRRLT